LWLRFHKITIQSTTTQEEEEEEEEVEEETVLGRDWTIRKMSLKNIYFLWHIFTFLVTHFINI
jgi:hypothetical protein